MAVDAPTTGEEVPAESAAPAEAAGTEETKDA